MKKIIDLFKKNRIVSGFIIVFVLLLLIMCIFWLSKKGTFGYNISGGNVLINCPTVVGAGQTVNCDVYLDMIDPISVYSLNAHYKLGTGLTFKSFDNPECTGEGCFALFQRTDSGFAVLNADGIVDGGYIGTLTFEMPDSIEPNEEFEVGLEDIELCYDDFGVESMITLDPSTKIIRTGNNVATLSSLVIPDMSFNEPFNSLEFNYTAEVPADTERLTLNYTTTSPGASVSINGIVNEANHIFELSFGHNIFTVIVTAEDDQTTLTYTVDIYREYKFTGNGIYPYIAESNILYTGSDTDDEIISKLGTVGDGFRYSFDLSNDTLYVLSSSDDEEVFATIDIVRYGVGYSIHDDIFYFNNGMKYSNLLAYVRDENLNVYLFDNSGDTIEDLNTVIEEGYYLGVYYNDQLLANYSFVASPLSFDSSLVVDDDDNVIARIPAGITVSELRKMITSDFTVSDRAGNEVSDYQIICTGYTLTIDVGGEAPLTYTLSVLGDVNGDGELHLNDVSMIYRYVMGNWINEVLVNLSPAQVYACDIINGGGIALNDVSRLYRFLMGSEDTLEVVSNE